MICSLPEAATTIPEGVSRPTDRFTGTRRRGKILMRTTEERAAIVIVRWIMFEPGSVALAALWPLLDASEQARADRFHLATDRDSYVLAHALLRAMLSCMAGIAAADLRFRTAKNGKPALDAAQSQPDLHFSLSHTRGLAACAVGRPYALGIDAEAWRVPAPIELAARYFAPTEAQLVAEQEPTERPSTFYRLWTLKEAYLKAIGQGLAAPLDSFAFSLDPVTITVAAPDHMAAWYFAEFRPGPAHSLALAVRSPQPVLVDAAAVTPARLGHPAEPLARLCDFP
jgi:4'-phosphopantetheinyl transferase